MLDTLRIFNELKESIPSAAAEKIAEIFGNAYDELRDSATKADFTELKEGHDRLEALHAQTQKTMNELAEAQKRTEVRVNELVEAQKRTEVKVTELTEAQKQTDIRMKELVVAQTRTEKAVRELAKEMKDVKKQLGGISMVVGYGIEDKLLPFLGSYAEKQYGMKVRSSGRRNIEYSETDYDEVNLYAEGERNGKPCFLIGECKAQPGKRDADRFVVMLKRLQKVLKGELFPILVGYTFPPQVERYVRKAHPDLRLVKTFEFELLARG